MERIGTMQFRAVQAPDSADLMIGQFMLSHPNVTGMQKDQRTQLVRPEHYVKTIRLYEGDTLLMTAETERVAAHEVEQAGVEQAAQALGGHVLGGGTEVLGKLAAHQVRPEFTCRFRWQVGSLAVWDNRRTLHYPVNDYYGYRRVMHRITIEGEQTY